MNDLEFKTYWDYFLLIDKDLVSTNRYVQHDTKNFRTYSSEFARVLLVTCAEIDTICRLLCKEIDNSCDFDLDSKWSGKIDDYATIILKKYPKLPTTEIKFKTVHKSYNPWSGWQLTPKYASPTWWNADNMVKHYRHSNFQKATLGNALFAGASLYVLLMYLHKTYPSQFACDDYPECFFSQSAIDNVNLEDQYSYIPLPDFQ